MKANQLRLWNTISICDKPIPEDYRTVDIKMLQSIMGGYQMYGIPLTPEILEKCGFDRYTEVPNDGIGDQLEVFEGLYGVAFFFDVHGALVFKDYHSNMNRPKYLHQLQNLYFALTGEELEVKL